jgi:hypothetical protein
MMIVSQAIDTDQFTYAAGTRTVAYFGAIRLAMDQKARDLQRTRGKEKL